jgi:hypothetical protein
MTSLTVELMAVASCSGAGSDVAVGDDHDGAAGVVGDHGADRARKQPLGAADASGADDDQVRGVGRSDEFLGGQVRDRPLQGTAGVG